MLPAETRRAVPARASAWALGFGVLIAALVYYQVWILQRINQVLRVWLMDRIQALSLRFHAESRVGDAMRS